MICASLRRSICRLFNTPGDHRSSLQGEVDGIKINGIIVVDYFYCPRSPFFLNRETPFHIEYKYSLRYLRPDHTLYQSRDVRMVYHPNLLLTVLPFPSAFYI